MFGTLITTYFFDTRVISFMRLDGLNICWRTWQQILQSKDSSAKGSFLSKSCCFALMPFFRAFSMANLEMSSPVVSYLFFLSSYASVPVPHPTSSIFFPLGRTDSIEMCDMFGFSVVSCFLLSHILSWCFSFFLKLSDI